MLFGLEEVRKKGACGEGGEEGRRGGERRKGGGEGRGGKEEKEGRKGSRIERGEKRKGCCQARDGTSKRALYMYLYQQ